MATAASREKTLEEIARRVRKCRKCGLWKRARNAVPGEGPVGARFFFVGQAPGAREDDAGRPFVGRAGKFFDRLLARAGIPREKIFVTGAVKHFPPANRPPTIKEIDACKPFLESQVEAVGPEMVVLMGNTAARALTGSGLRALGKVFETRGKRFFATFHPAAGMRFPSARGKMFLHFNALGKLWRD